MKTKVKKLFDIDNISQLPEIEPWKVEDEEVEELVRALGEEKAAETETDRVAEGDAVFCRAESGPLADRTVIIYPGRSMPKAESAEAAVIGASVGDTVKTAVNGSETVLNVERILRRLPAEVNDALVRGENIEGVSTVAEYRDHVRRQTEAQRKNLSAKYLSADLRRMLIEGSEYDVDEAERDAWADKAAREMFDAYVEAGEDPHIPEEGTDFLTDEEALAVFRERALPEFFSTPASRAFCVSKGVSFSPEEREFYAEHGFTGEEAEDMFFENKTWDLLYNIAMEILEGKR